ncbi:MAG: DUF4214 domain-containing protein [Acidimicrobiia bacterium]|nr:DUF4214 domain-containing protein [Acidimicrobiia bacterium]
MPRHLRHTIAVLVALGLAISTPSPATAQTSVVAPSSAGGQVVALSSPKSGANDLSIDRLYLAFFLREPDAGGLAYWHDQAANGTTLSAVSSYFAASPEFTVRYGHLADDAFVDLVYANVMGREPDASGRAHWVGVLRDRRLSRGGVMLAFSDSAEFKTRSGLIGLLTEVQVVEAQPGEKRLILVDRSGRSATPLLPPLAERRSYIHVRFPTDGSGRPLVDRATPLLVRGSYRNGSAPTCSPQQRDDAIVVCLGFARQDQQSGVQWGDIPNNSGDVTALLDHLLTDRSLVGRIDTERIVYTGASMGGISGLYFAHPDFQDPRIRAVHSVIGFAPFAIAEITEPVDWVASPAILMTNNLDDPGITYELARRTVEAAGPGRVTFVTSRTGGHGTPCRAAQRHADAWIEHHLVGGPAPSADTVTGCAAIGVLPGGTTGFGLADPFRR